MSTPAEIINDALIDTHTNPNNYDPQTKGIRALNRVSDLINNEIVKRGKEDYFWDVFTQDSVIGQTEYNIEKGFVNWDGVVNTVVNIKEISKVYIKYDENDDFHTPAPDKASINLPLDRDYYAENQSKNDPISIIQDRSVFIYPKPDAIVPLGVKIEAIYTPPKILYNSPESWLPLQPDKHNIYSLGMEWLIYKSQGKNKAAEAQESKKNFDQELTKLITHLKGRNNQPVSKSLGDLSPYC